MSKKIRQKVKIQGTIQNFINEHQIGYKLAELNLGTTPQYLVLEKVIEIKILDSGVMLVKCLFHSNDGDFEGSLAIKEYDSEDKVLQLVNTNFWIHNRVKSNNRIKIPQIFSTGGGFIVYEGVDGHSFHESDISLNVKLSLAGNTLASYHTTETTPVNHKRYYSLLKNLIEMLPVNQERKEKLTSYGISLFTYFNKKLSGTYGYGDFHSENLIISPNGTQVALINHEYVESEIGADRFEDVAAFFIYDAYQEYLESKNLDHTINNIELFLEEYNRYLGRSGMSLELIYGKTFRVALFFYLGLISLTRGASASLDMTKTRAMELTDEARIEMIIQSYKLTRFIWLEGAKYLPASAFPKLRPRTSKNGWIITWPIIGNVLINLLKNDDHFRFIFDFPNKNTPSTISVTDAMNKWMLIDKKDFSQKLNELNKWTKSSLFTSKKDSIILASDWKNKLNIPQFYDGDWERSSRVFFQLWLKNPLNKFVQLLEEFYTINTKNLAKIKFFSKKQLKEIINHAKQRNLIIESNNNIELDHNWKKILNLPLYFEFSFFQE